MGFAVVKKSFVNDTARKMICQIDSSRKELYDKLVDKAMEPRKKYWLFGVVLRRTRSEAEKYIDSLKDKSWSERPDWHNLDYLNSWSVQYDYCKLLLKMSELVAGDEMYLSNEDFQMLGIKK